MYPAFIVNNKIKPKHIDVKFIELYKYFYDERIKLKPLSKKDKKIKGIIDAYKLLLNGGVYGKFGEKTSWLYDYQAMLSVTIGCQLSILMLIEDYVLNGIKVISANTKRHWCFKIWLIAGNPLESLN